MMSGTTRGDCRYLSLDFECSLVTVHSLIRRPGLLHEPSASSVTDRAAMFHCKLNQVYDCIVFVVQGDRVLREWTVPASTLAGSSGMFEALSPLKVKRREHNIA